MIDHMHMMISIPPKYAVSNIVGYIKGKSAIHAHADLRSGIPGIEFRLSAEG